MPEMEFAKAAGARAKVPTLFIDRPLPVGSVKAALIGWLATPDGNADPMPLTMRGGSLHGMAVGSTQNLSVAPGAFLTPLGRLSMFPTTLAV
jgi:hypothetical protein